MPETTANFVAPDFLALTIGIVVFFVGVLITQRVSFLRTYNIPEPVTGGFVAAERDGAVRFKPSWLLLSRIVRRIDVLDAPRAIGGELENRLLVEVSKCAMPCGKANKASAIVAGAAALNQARPGTRERGRPANTGPDRWGSVAAPAG